MTMSDGDERMRVTLEHALTRYVPRISKFVRTKLRAKDGHHDQPRREPAMNEAARGAMKKGRRRPPFLRAVEFN